MEAASIDHDGLLGRTAMHWAAAKGKEEAVALLHQAGGAGGEGGVSVQDEVVLFVSLCLYLFVCCFFFG